MSVTLIRAALEGALNAVSPAITTIWQNTTGTPAAGQPYQRVALLFARPTNDETSARRTEQGFLQVTLCYPAGKGPGAAEARANLLKTSFPYGLTVTSGGQDVMIAGTPEMLAAYDDADRFCIPVRIPFWAHVEA